MIGKISVFSFLLFTMAFSSNISAQDTVTAGQAGAIKIGMTVAEAAKAAPDFKFKRTSDGDGVALIGVEKNGKVVLTLYAGEEDNESQINMDGIIEQIEVWDSSYKLESGVGPETPLEFAAMKYGGIEAIMVSEIEARQYADFKKGPDGVGFRIDYSGVFKDGENTTTKYKKGAKIFSLILQGDGSESNVGFFSDYTSLDEDCETEKAGEGGHVSTFCKGLGGYRVHLYDSATNLEIVVESTIARKSISVARESLNFKPNGQMLEWRIKNGEPFAVIMRGNKYETGDDGLIKYPAVVTGEYLFVRGLPGFESINADVNLRTTKFAEEEARKIADEGFAKLFSPDGKSYLEVDTADTNLMIITAANKGESWVKSPMQMAWKLGGEFEEMRTREVSFEAAGGESSDSIRLTIIDDGLLDDSVKAEKWVYELIREENGVWKAVSIKKSWSCWPNRGHEEFSASPCI